MCILAFTGHRDRLAEPGELRALLRRLRPTLCVHGGAIGFDTQVETLCRELGIPTRIYRPDYRTHGRSAPLERNKLIVADGEQLIALWDGRQSGGTAMTVRYARKCGVPVHRLGHPQNAEPEISLGIGADAP